MCVMNLGAVVGWRQDLSDGPHKPTFQLELRTFKGSPLTGEDRVEALIAQS